MAPTIPRKRENRALTVQGHGSAQRSALAPFEHFCTFFRDAQGAEWLWFAPREREARETFKAGQTLTVSAFWNNGTIARPVIVS